MKTMLYASLSGFAFALLLTTSACKPTPADEPTPTPAAEPVCDLLSRKEGSTKTFDVAYNAQHLTTKTSYYDPNTGALQSAYDFAYDANNRIITQIGKDAAGVTTVRADIIYGANNKVFQTKSYNTAGELTYQVTYEYDSDGRVNRNSSSSLSLGVFAPSGYEVLEYTGASKLPTRNIRTSQPSGTRTIKTYTYDANGNMTERATFNAPIGGQSIINSRYLYTFDNKKLITVNFPGYGRSGFNSGLGDNFIPNKNNINVETQINYDAAGVETGRYVNSRTYEYGSNGYPTKSTYTPQSGTSRVDTYEYHCH